MIMTRTLHSRFLFLASLLLASCGVADDNAPSHPVADFEIGCMTIVDSTVTFTNRSKDATLYRWDFGNGSSSTEKSPTITYTDTGSYRVTLIGSNAAESDTLSKTVRIFPHVPTSKMLAVPLVTAATNLLGWAAAVEMILRYHGVETDQCAIARDRLGIDCCRQSNGCDVGSTPQDLDNALYKSGGMVSVQQTGPMDLATLEAEIAQDRPVLIAYSDGTYAFYEVAYGYNQFHYIYVRDPYSGDDALPYNALINRSGGQGPYYWSYSLYCIRKP
jgi:hypothetical protein